MSPSLESKTKSRDNRIHPYKRGKEKQLPSGNTILPSRFACFISKSMQEKQAHYPSIIYPNGLYNYRTPKSKF